MTRRPGFTMTEVLTALFIMALGSIAILTLFPLGMLNMGQALKDDRTAQAAAAADGYMRWYWKQYVVENPTDTTFADTGAGTRAYNTAFDNPGSGTPLTAANDSDPSYPVFVDPIRYNYPGATNQSWVGGNSGYLLPRRNLNQPTAMGPVQSLRSCTLLDGLTYDATGLPALPNGSNVERDMRYTWLWVLQRPVNRDKNTVKMTIVVFDKRGTFPSPEDAITNVSFTPGTRAITVTAAAVATTTGIHKGTWIMDAGGPALHHANFYRVISATEDGLGNVNLELDSPIKRNTGTGTYTGTIFVLAGVSEVFARGDLTP